MVDLTIRGLNPTGQVYANLPAAALVEMALRRHEGELTVRGALVANTGKLTGRSPKDKYVVVEPGSKDAICWGPVNQPMEPAVFSRLLDKTRSYLQNRDLFIFDGWACADPRYRLPVRVIAEKAWHVLFSRCLLLRPAPADLEDFQPELTIFTAPGFHADPAHDGTRAVPAAAGAA